MKIDQLITGVLDRAAESYRKYLDELVADFEQCAQHCESPIERLLYVAYRAFLEHRRATDCSFMGGPVSIFPCWHVTDGEEADPPLEGPGESNFILCQAPIDPFRVDFLVKRFASPFLNLQPIFETPAVVIECDGHDFHERTKEQAARDRSRDRELQTKGHPVLRFTGSEIWRDPWLCAATIDRFLSGILDSQYTAFLAARSE